jgi:hypothetical protein
VRANIERRIAMIEREKGAGEKRFIKMRSIGLAVEGMGEEKVIEKIKRAYAELGFVPPDIRSLSEVTLRDAENGIEMAKWEVENDINGIIARAVHTLLAAERGEWDNVEHLAGMIRGDVEHIMKKVDYAKRCIKLIERVRSILEKDLNTLDV